MRRGQLQSRLCRMCGMRAGTPLAEVSPPVCGCRGIRVCKLCEREKPGSNQPSVLFLLLFIYSFLRGMRA